MHAVGGLPLPPHLVAAIESGAWRPPADPKVYETIFHDAPEQPDFYDLAGIDRQNKSWQRMPIEQVFGEPVAGRSLGIDPGRSVVIGDLGPDMPIVLDYRNSDTDPRVLYLAFAGGPVWTEVAPSFGSLLSRLGLQRKV